jgi:hypothetical protein
MLDPESIRILFWLLVVAYIIYFLQRNDEFLSVVLLFFYSSGLNRWFLIQSKKANYVYVAYARNIFEMNDMIGQAALNYFFWGTATLSITYMLIQYMTPKVKKKIDDNDTMRYYIKTRQSTIVTLFIVFLGFNVVISGQLTQALAGGAGQSMGLSYYIYFGFALGGLILLLFLAFRSLNPKTNGSSRMIFGALIILGGYLTYDISARFRFLSWIVSVGIVLSKKLGPLRKLLVFAVGGSIASLVFSYAGAIRLQHVKEMNFEQQLEVAYERMGSAEDQNMLDGLMMIMQVYPTYLDHAHGMEHFEILLRPIPRAIWAGKPVGSYINKLHLNDNMANGATVGISPTLYGSFYAEFGLLGIIGFSILYAWGFVRLFRYSQKYGSELNFIIRGMVISSTIPLLRGGDLPGIIAFVGMTYWPVVIFLYQYNAFLDKIGMERQYKQMELNTAENILKGQRELRVQHSR